MLDNPWNIPQEGTALAREPRIFNETEPVEVWSDDATLTSSTVSAIAGRNESLDGLANNLSDIWQKEGEDETPGSSASSPEVSHISGSTSIWGRDSKTFDPYPWIGQRQDASPGPASNASLPSSRLVELEPLYYVNSLIPQLMSEDLLDGASWEDLSAQLATEVPSSVNKAPGEAKLDSASKYPSPRAVQQQHPAARDYRPNSWDKPTDEMPYDPREEMVRPLRPLQGTCQCGHWCPRGMREPTLEELEHERKKKQRKLRRKYVDILTDQGRGPIIGSRE